MICGVTAGAFCLSCDLRCISRWHFELIFADLLLSESLWILAPSPSLPFCALASMSNLIPRVLSYPPYGARDPGKRWSRGSRPKLIPREESFVSHFFGSGLFATFTQWSQQQDRFANPTTTIAETKGNFCLNQTIR